MPWSGWKRRWRRCGACNNPAFHSACENGGMNNVLKFLVPIGCVVAVGVAYQLYGWMGVAAVTGGIIMWLLLHFNRMLAVLRKAQNKPVGYVGSAVMLNARLKPGMALMHVMAMTQALGELRTAQNAQPEVYRWTDGGDSWVDVTFVAGKVTTWQMVRPAPAAEDEAGAAPAP